MLSPVQAWAAWHATERALRRAQPLPASLFALPTAAAVLVAGLLVGLGILFR
ncbi:hypothetical protein [Pseudonocardia ammonioxydans]|uniref:hypothetical protein n=1 Tax=Pseudonocardia ammonioxydans TaxID=260086 RepID=UPI0015A5B70E|nr:hypothetical protein [Pseudonocardia ammonioxydans]